VDAGQLAELPEEIEAAGGTIAIYQWPKHGDTLVDGRSMGDLTSIFNYKRDIPG
jgi:hypothetical protein